MEEAIGRKGFISMYMLRVDKLESIPTVIAELDESFANSAAETQRPNRKQTSSVAVLRSLGFSARRVMNCLLAESVTIGLAGGIVGSVGGYLMLKAVGFALLGPFRAAGVPPAVLFESLAVAALIGFMSAFVPARAAVRRSIVDTLRAVA